MSESLNEKIRLIKEFVVPKCKPSAPNLYELVIATDQFEGIGTLPLRGSVRALNTRVIIIFLSRHDLVEFL